MWRKIGLRQSSQCPFLTQKLQLLAKAIKLYFTADSTQYENCIANNYLIFPEVTKSILETVYRFYRNNVTRQIFLRSLLVTLLVI